MKFIKLDIFWFLSIRFSTFVLLWSQQLYTITFGLTFTLRSIVWNSVEIWILVLNAFRNFNWFLRRFRPTQTFVSRKLLYPLGEYDLWIRKILWVFFFKKMRSLIVFFKLYFVGRTQRVPLLDNLWNNFWLSHSWELMLVLVVLLTCKLPVNQTKHMLQHKKFNISLVPKQKFENTFDKKYLSNSFKLAQLQCLPFTTWLATLFQTFYTPSPSFLYLCWQLIIKLLSL